MPGLSKMLRRLYSLRINVQCSLRGDVVRGGVVRGYVVGSNFGRATPCVSRQGSPDGKAAAGRPQGNQGSPHGSQCSPSRGYDSRPVDMRKERSGVSLS